MDEATAHLDPVMERKIGTMISSLTKDKTLITVSHRLRAARDADQIFVLHDGRLVEQGSHSKLLSANGLYAKLFRLQQALGADEAVG